MTEARGNGMGNSGSSGGGDIFDVRKIRRLVELMNDHELNEIDLRQADQRIRIRRGGEPIITTGGVAAPVPTATPATTAPAAQTTPAPAGEEQNVAFVKSPMVGTFYSASNPDSPPFVKVGDAIGPETTVCIVEAMKVFNEIPAEVSGKILACWVENGDPVEYGQPLFKVAAG
jgi:acetyl-CoA carboxylase biotin carboxyl carrier protein